MTEDHDADEAPLTLEVTATEARAIITGLRFLLEAERDPQQIDELKRLIGRLERLVGKG